LHDISGSWIRMFTVRSGSTVEVLSMIRVAGAAKRGSVTAMSPIWIGSLLPFRTSTCA
jgi:hypothetical protein